MSGAVTRPRRPGTERTPLPEPVSSAVAAPDTSGGPSSPRRLPRLAWLVVLAGGIALFEALRRDLLASQNPNVVPALLLIGAAVVPVSFTVFIYGRRVPFEVSSGQLAVTAVLGGAVGILVASTLEFDTLRDFGVLPMVAVAVIEEAAKMLVPICVLLVMIRRRCVAPVDGLLIGVASGAGFAALETMGYAFVVLIQTKGNLAAVDGVLALRGLLSPAAHMAWTGLVAAALWSAASAGWTRRSVARLAAAYLVAVALHTAWDSIATISGYAVLAAVALFALTYTLTRLRIQIPVPQRYALTAAHRPTR